MLQSAGQKILVGVFASAVLGLAAPVWAANDSGYVVDSNGKAVMSDSGCVLAPNQPYNALPECGGVTVGDSDGDGVPDDKDKCPNTPKGVAVDENGCPKDTDGDGVPDYLDACPNNTPEEISKGVDEKGCPKDSDGDGVPDYRDDCPNTAPEDIHKVNERGCVDEIIRFDMNESVYFDFDKSNLKPAGTQALDALVAESNKRGAMQGIEIIGHTDHIGTDAYNQKLSERRAQTVANYLISKGIAANKIVARGVGESGAKGKTPAERAKDRRVVVDVRISK